MIPPDSCITDSSNNVDGRTKPKVLIFRKQLLPISETFILDQFRSYRSWSPILVGYRRVTGLDVSDTNPFTLASPYPTILENMRLRFYQHSQYFGYIPSTLLGLAEGQRIRLIHAHFAYDALLVYDLAKAIGVPLIITLHGDDILRDPSVWKSGSQGQFFRLYPFKLKSLFQDRNVHFVAVSKALAHRALERGVPRDRLHVRYVGADSKSFSPSKTHPRRRSQVLFVGRLVEFKGCEYLIKAMEVVQKTCPDARLVVVGDGPLRGDLEALTKQLGVAATFRGAAGRQEVSSLMSESSLFCLPSLTDSEGVFEAFGMVILEAMMSGLPVVTSARGGAEAIVNGSTGVICREKDVEGLAAAITGLLLDCSLAEAISQRGRNHAITTFDINACTRKLEELYDRIV